MRGRPDFTHRHARRCPRGLPLPPGIGWRRTKRALGVYYARVRRDGRQVVVASVSDRRGAEGIEELVRRLEESKG